MELVLNEKYVLFVIVSDINPSFSDTFSAICLIEGNEKVVVRFNKDSIVEVGKIYHVRGTALEFKRKIHIFADFHEELNEMGMSERERDIIVNKLMGTEMVECDVIIKYIEDTIDAIEDEIIKSITKTIYDRYKDRFREYPAATKFHHAYKHGLLLHTYNVLRLGKSYVSIYPHVNKDLVYAGIILHDMMKCREMNEFKNDYTLEGKLLGHVTMAAEEVYKTAFELGFEGCEEVLVLNHIVLSHHDEPDFGSPKRPQTIEALIVHLCDLSDAKIQPAVEALSKTKEGELSEMVPTCDKARMYKHKLSR